MRGGKFNAFLYLFIFIFFACDVYIFTFFVLYFFFFFIFWLRLSKFSSVIVYLQLIQLRVLQLKQEKKYSHKKKTFQLYYSFLGTFHYPHEAILRVKKMGGYLNDDSIKRGGWCAEEEEEKKNIVAQKTFFFFCYWNIWDNFFPFFC